MSDLSTEQDLAFRARPWLAKAVANQLFMLKYVFYENDAIFLATTLDKVYVEILSPSRLLSRASASGKLTQPGEESYSYNQSLRKTSYSQNASADSQNRDAAIQNCVNSLDALFSPGEAWDDVDVEQGEEDSFYDLMLDISSEKFDWNIKFNKVHDSEALSMIREHILHPLLALSGCLIDRLGETSSGVAELQTAIDASATTAVRRLTPLLKNTLNKPVLQTSISRWNQTKQGLAAADHILEEYPVEAYSPIKRPNVAEPSRSTSETPPPDSPQYRRDIGLPTLDLSPAQAQMSAEMEMRAFSPSPLQRADSRPDVEEEAPVSPDSEMDWNSDMTEPESDDDAATRKFEQAKERTLAKRARIAAVRTQGPPQDEIPDTPDQVDDSQGQLEPTDVQTIPSSPPASPPQSFVPRPTGQVKRKPSPASSASSKKMRSVSPGETRIMLDKTESQKHEAALAIRNALQATTPVPDSSAGGETAGTAAHRGRTTRAPAGRGRGRGRGKSVW